MKLQFKSARPFRMLENLLVKHVIILVVSLPVFLTNASAQDTAQKTRLSEMLESYYDLKDALVSGNQSSASAAANLFVRNSNGISYENISEGNINALLKDAAVIADAGEIRVQRQYFALLSSNMAEVAKALKLSRQPVYIQYCPMKKAYWLSKEKVIKNPYYGNSMLSCGRVTDTIE